MDTSVYRRVLCYNRSVGLPGIWVSIRGDRMDSLQVYLSQLGSWEVLLFLPNSDTLADLLLVYTLGHITLV